MFEVKKFYADGDTIATGGGTTETVEEKAARLEAELVTERKKISDQNSYITKLEGQVKAPVQAPAAKVVTPTPQAQPQSQATRDPYLVEMQTKDIINTGLEAVKAQVGEAVFAEIKDDVVRIARANIKDPSSVPAELFERVTEMALGRAMKDEAKRVKIAGAYVKTPAPVTPTPQTVVVQSPGQAKIGTMQPGDRQNLGTQQTAPGQQAPVKRSPREFVNQMRQK